MEVETQTHLPNFNLQSNTSPFHFTRDFNVDTLFPEQSEVSPKNVTEEQEESVETSESAAVVTEEQESDKSTESAAVVTEEQEESDKSTESAALKVQKVYRSYRTRRRLADSAVVADELWWQLLDFALLSQSTTSFYEKSESAVSRWNRIGLNASKVGKGLSKDEKAKKLAFQHWIEAIDPRHRYGHSLQMYYNVWCSADAGQPFFYWLDIGDGKDIDLLDCPRSTLRQQCIKYLGPQQRDHYEYVVVDGKFVHKQSGELLDTTSSSKGAKWIFVMSTFKKLYAGEKKKGIFHHSSFLAGGATLAAGRLVVVDGVLKSISAYSGHYRPTEDNLSILVNILKEENVNFDGVEVRSSTDDFDYNGDFKSKLGDSKSDLGELVDVMSSDRIEPTELSETKPLTKPSPLQISIGTVEPAQNGSKTPYQRTLSGGLQSPRPDVPRKQVLQRINSKKVAKSYQLGHQLSMKWTTGVGPRIGCVADYPQDVREKALEFVNLSPRSPLTPKQYGSLISPSPAQATSLF